MFATTAPGAPLVTEPLRDFDDFYRVEYPRLLRVLSAADVSAADALQEAFTKAAASGRRFPRYEHPAAWVRQVAVRRMLNERRSMRRRDAAIGALRGRRTRRFGRP